MRMSASLGPRSVWPSTSGRPAAVAGLAAVLGLACSSDRSPRPVRAGAAADPKQTAARVDALLAAGTFWSHGNRPHSSTGARLSTTKRFCAARRST